MPLQFLAVGVFINCFAHVPYCFLQSLGRPDAAAKLFVCELIPYGLLAWWMVERHGIAGAAAAWSVRVAIEVVLLLWIARRVFSLSAVHVIESEDVDGIRSADRYGHGSLRDELYPPQCHCGGCQRVRGVDGRIRPRRVEVGIGPRRPGFGPGGDEGHCEGCSGRHLEARKQTSSGNRGSRKSTEQSAAMK